MLEHPLPQQAYLKVKLPFPAGTSPPPTAKVVDIYAVSSEAQEVYGKLMPYSMETVFFSFSREIKAGTIYSMEMQLRDLNAINSQEEMNFGQIELYTVSSTEENAIILDQNDKFLMFGLNPSPSIDSSSKQLEFSIQESDEKVKGEVGKSHVVRVLSLKAREYIGIY